MPALSALLHVSEATVYSWFNRWERGGLAGLANAKGQSRPAILQAADREQVEVAVRVNHQQIKELVITCARNWPSPFRP